MRIIRRLTLGTLCTAVGGLLLCGMPAQAVAAREPIGSFGPGGPGSGVFEDPQSIAVDQNTGDVYVYDFDPTTEEGNVYKFNAQGEPINAEGDPNPEGKPVIEGTGGEEDAMQIAVDSSNGPDKGDIYVDTSQEVSVYAETGAKLGTLTEEEPCGVAVDPSGAVYVAFYHEIGEVEGEEVIRKYTPATNPVKETNYTSSLWEVGGEVCNIAADSAGDIYATGYKGKHGVTKYEASQFNTMGTAAKGTQFDASEEGATLAVNTLNGNVYIDEQEDVAEYRASSRLLETFGSGVLSESYGVAVGQSSDDVYVAAGEAEEVEIFSIPTLAVTPDVTTGEATGATRTTATHISGSVNPEGLPITLCEFEYGTGAAGSYGHTVACEHTPSEEGSEPVSVSAGLTGLTAGTTYHYRLVVSAEGKNYSGPEESFETLPAVEGIQTVTASEVGDTGATLNGSLEPNGFDTHYFFEYGESEAYGSTTARQDAGESSEVTQVHASISGLEPNRTYYFRLVAENSYGTTAAASGALVTNLNGAGQTSATPESSTPLALPPAPPLLGTPTIAFPTGSQENTQSPTITVVGHGAKGNAATIEVSVPSAGKLVASARGLTEAAKKAGGATTLTLKLHLSKGEAAFLKKHRGRKLKAKIDLRFTPKKGAELTTSVTVLIA